MTETYSITQIKLNNADYETIKKLLKMAVDVYAEKLQSLLALYRNAIKKQDYKHAEQLGDEIAGLEHEINQANYYASLFFEN